MDQEKQLRSFMKRLHRRVITQHLLRCLMRCLPFGMLCGALLELISCVRPWYGVHFYAALAVAASAATALIRGVLRAPSMKKAALLLDETGLKERTVTALELIGQENPFAALQREDALRHLEGLNLRERLPYRHSAKRWLALLLSLVLCLIPAALPTASKDEALSRHQVEETAKEEIEKLEDQLSELDRETLSSEEYEEYAALLRELQQEFQGVTTQEELAQVTERAEYKLSSVTEQSAPGQPEEGKSQLQREAAKAQELLDRIQENADESALSAEQLQELQEALEALAESTTDQALQERLQEAASQLQAGGISSDTLAAAQATLSTMTQSAAQTADNSSQNGESGNGQNGAAGSGQSDGSSQGGNGSGSGNGQDGSSGGSGGGNGGQNGSGSQGGSGSGSGTGWNYGGKDGTQKGGTYDGELVSVPTETGQDENLTGQAGEGASYTAKGGDSLTWSGNQIAFQQVLGSYSDQAVQKVQGSNYPGSVQDVVKSYFAELGNAE